MCSSWWKTTTTCATSAHDINNNCNDNNSNNSLGFRGQNNLKYSTKTFNGGGVAMGSVSNHDGDDRRSGVVSALSSENHRELKPPVCKQRASNKLLTLPTILTIGRVVAIPVIVATFYMSNQLGTTATTGIFIAAAITDWLDGYLARKMKLGTAFGAFLDPVADKLMVATTLVLLCTKPPEAAMLGQQPWLFTVPSTAVIGREITMSAVREWAASQAAACLLKVSLGKTMHGFQAVAVNNSGKWKTATQMTSLAILLAIRDPRSTRPSKRG